MTFLNQHIKQGLHQRPHGSAHSTDCCVARTINIVSVHWTGTNDVKSVKAKLLNGVQPSLFHLHLRCSCCDRPKGPRSLPGYWSASANNCPSLQPHFLNRWSCITSIMSRPAACPFNPAACDDRHVNFPRTLAAGHAAVKDGTHGEGGQQYLMTLLIIWFEHKNNIKITCFVLVNNLHHTATWWRCNAKLVCFPFLFFQKYQNCSSAIQFICSSRHSSLRPRTWIQTPPSPLPRPAPLKEK